MQGTGLPQAPTVSECQSTEKPTQPLSGEVLGSNLFGATVGNIGNSIDSLSDLKIAKRSPWRQKAGPQWNSQQHLHRHRLVIELRGAEHPLAEVQHKIAILT